MSEFWEKYKDPRWQKRRLEIMSLYSFRCAHCDAGDKTLNVHHKIYRKGRDPWDYDDHELQCLCEDCHEESHKLHKSLKECIAYLDDSSVDVVLGYVRAHMASEHPDAKMYIQTAEQLMGVADFACATDRQVENTSGEDHVISGRQLMDIRRGNKEILKKALGEE